MKLFIRWLISALSIYLVAQILPGVHIVSFMTALLVAVVLGFVNVVVKPVLVLFTLPITILTLGLFLVVINALILLLVSAWVPGFTVDGFLTALVASVLISLVSTLLTRLIRES